ncbi:EndoU domain-containing protein, partial [Patescibacteria group bacterium]|nr:EndoU domain-containing protein [Patescibacteria group bacterium]
LSEQVDNARGLLEVFASQTGLKSTNVDGIPVLREFQEMELYNASSFRVSEEELFEALMKRYPEWRNPTTYQQRIMRSDTMGAMRENLGCYAGVTGNILNSAVNVYFVAQRGGDQNAALEIVKQSIDIWNSTQKILELKIETGISLPNLGEALSEGLRIYQDNVDIFYNLQGMKKREMTKQEYRSLNQFWQNTYIVRADGVVVRRDGGDGGGRSVVVSVGEPIASAGGGVTGESNEQPKSRSWQRAQRLWQEAVKKYSDVRVRNYVDNVEGKPNLQRERRQEQMTAILTAMAEDEGAPEDEVPEDTPEEDPNKPDIEWAEEVVASLNRIIDTAVADIEVEKRLQFGADLEVALDQYGESILYNFRAALEQTQDDEQPVPQSIDWTDSVDYSVLFGSAPEISEEEQSLYVEIYDDVADLLNLIQKGFDDVVSEYQYRLDTMSQELLTNNNLSAVDKIALTAEITSTATMKSLVSGAKFMMPETPEMLAFDAALSIVGVPIIRRAPALIKGALSQVDNVAGTKLAVQFAGRINTVSGKIDNLAAKVSGRMSSKTAKAIEELQKEYTHINVAHILDADINSIGRPSGGHVHSILKREDIAIEALEGIDSNGVIKVKLTMLDPKTGEIVKKGVPHTFFPSSWSERQVIEAIDEAFRSPNIEWLKPDKWESTIGNIKIQGYVDNNGKITSAFPLIQP